MPEIHFPDSPSFSAELYEDLNRILPTTAAPQAYYLGIVTVECWTNRQEPSRMLLEAVSRCENLNEVNKAYEKLRDKHLAYRSHLARGKEKTKREVNETISRVLNRRAATA